MMRKKPIVDPIIAPEILEMARRSVELDKPVPAKRCAVCDAACSALIGPPQPVQDEYLCWVCRRLKISAWRDSDQQISAQE